MNTEAPTITVPDETLTGSIFSIPQDSIHNGSDLKVRNVWIKGESMGGVEIRNVANGLNNYSYTFGLADQSAGFLNAGSGVVSPADPVIFPDHAINKDGTIYENGLPADEYELQIQNIENLDTDGDVAVDSFDQLTCFSSYTFFIKEPEFALSDSTTTQDYLGGVNVSCVEASDGVITVQGKGGIAPYSFKLIGRTSEGVVIDLPAVNKNTSGYDRDRHEYAFTQLGALNNGNLIDYELTITDAVGAVQVKTNDFDGSPLRLAIPEDLRFAGEIQRSLNEEGFDINCGGETGTVGLQTVRGVLENQLQILNVPDEEVFNQTIESTTLKEFQVTGLVAGEYRAFLSDANRSETSCIEELTFTITAPDALSLELTSRKLCSGDNSGSLLARANGGIMQEGLYTYALRNVGTDQRDTLEGPEVTFVNLVQGTYEVSVTDKYSCTFSDQITIADPTEIEAFFTLTDILCYGDSTGIATAALTGGALPLNATWFNSENEELASEIVNANGVSSITNVPFGTYRLLVEDANSCSIETFAELTQPDPVPVELGGGTIICPGTGTGGVQYAWTFNDEVIATDPVIEVSRAGTYAVTVTDQDGCEGMDAFEPTVLEDPLNTDFGMPSEAYEGDTVAIIDITYPLPDSVNWVWQDGASLYALEEDCEKFIFYEPGVYSIALQTHLGECEDELTKFITILEGEEPGSIGGRLGHKETITSFKANPNEGNFTITIGLAQEKEVNLRLISQDGIREHFHQAWYGESFYTFPFEPANLQPGVYLLALETEDEKQVKRVMIR